MKHLPILSLSFLSLCLFTGCSKSETSSNANTPSQIVTSTSPTPSETSNFNKTFYGRMSDAEIEIKLVRNGENLSGTEKAKDSKFTYDFTLKGYIDAHQNVTITEYTEAGKEGGEYRGKFVNPNRFVGTYQPYEGDAESVILSAEKDSSGDAEVSQPASVEEQAKAAVKDYFEAAFTKCGDSYYSFERYLHQYSNPRFVIAKTNSLTEADRLNGATWSGQVDFVYGAERMYDGGWQSWENYDHWKHFTFNVAKFGSRWQVESDWTPTWLRYRKVKCTDVP